MAMSEHILKLMLSELTTVRVHCKAPSCGGIVELPIGKLSTKYRGGECPLCKTEFVAINDIGDNPFFLLEKVALMFAKAEDKVEIEFVVPAREKA